MVPVTICYPTYCGAQSLSLSLGSIYELTDYDDEFSITILDDGSPLQNRLETEAVANKYGAQYLLHSKNRGIPAAWNSLVRQAETDYIVLINDDVCAIDPFWLTCLIGFIKMNREAGLKIGPVGLPKVSAPSPRLTHTVSGWCMAFHREVFDAVGGFWEELIRYYEDTSFCIEAAKQGYFPVQLGNPCMVHAESGTLDKHPFMQDACISDEVGEEILASPGTKKRYRDYCQIAGISAWGYTQWVEEMLAINPRASLSRYMFCKRFGIDDMIEHYHEEIERKYIVPLCQVWDSQVLRWFESDGKQYLPRQRESNT